MCMLRAGLQSLRWSLFTTVAVAYLLNARPKVAVDQIPVGTDGSEGLKALTVAPVSLMANGMLPLSTPVRVLLFVLCLHLHLGLPLSVWLLGRENEMHFVFSVSDCWQMALRSWSCTCSGVLTWLVRGA
jgi:hypothetical protein